MAERIEAQKCIVQKYLCGHRLNEIYRDVRAEINAHKEMKSLYLKSNKIALEKRKLGINGFGNRNWNDAIDWFNESLCFAEIGTKCVGIAYFSRILDMLTHTQTQHS